jgi:hypothetical protein
MIQLYFFAAPEVRIRAPPISHIIVAFPRCFALSVGFPGMVRRASSGSGEGMDTTIHCNEAYYAFSMWNVFPSGTAIAFRMSVHVSKRGKIRKWQPMMILA